MALTTFINATTLWRVKCASSSGWIFCLSQDRLIELCSWENCFTISDCNCCTAKNRRLTEVHSGFCFESYSDRSLYFLVDFLVLQQYSSVEWLSVVLVDNYLQSFRSFQMTNDWWGDMHRCLVCTRPCTVLAEHFM